MHGDRLGVLFHSGASGEPCIWKVERAGLVSDRDRRADGITVSDAIVVESLSRRFEIYERPFDVLRELVSRKPRHDVFWALRNISFTLKEGQRLGIIGPNGSGKSTLLRIIAGNLSPTSGTVLVNGRVSSLLSLNSVFNPEESGIENIRLNLLINGCPAPRINDYIEEIIDFSELGPFIYNQVKTYSTGMNARLSFAIATAIQPEILVIDEVLSVGDAYFVGKALRRMVEICNKGKALLFVSHDISAVQRLCDSVLWLDQGEIREFGASGMVLGKYEADARAREDQATRQANTARATESYGMALAEEFTHPSIHRYRLVRQGGAKAFGDTHFVRRISIRVGSQPETRLDVGSDDLFTPEKGYGVDAMGSEWGRSYERHGSRCRLVFAQRGRRKGAQFLLGHQHDGEKHVFVSFEASSIAGTEELAVEYLDMEVGDWVPLVKGEQILTADGWTSSSFSGTIRPLTEEHFHRKIEAVRQQQRPDVEIDGVLFVAGVEGLRMVREHESFDILVKIRANRPTPAVDVGIKILRSDGVYVFWQSNGLTNQPIENFDGSASVKFCFRDNYLSAGEYYVTAYCANGWDLATNYPYSEVFDRRVNALTFAVQRETSALDFGQINQRVPVVIERNA